MDFFFWFWYPAVLTRSTRSCMKSIVHNGCEHKKKPLRRFPTASLKRGGSSAGKRELDLLALNTNRFSCSRPVNGGRNSQFSFDGDFKRDHVVCSTIASEPRPPVAR